MSNYKQSTQSKNWIFSQDQINTMQIKKFERGLAIIADLNKSIEQELAVQGGQPTGKNQQKISLNIKSKIIIYISY